MHDPARLLSAFAPVKLEAELESLSPGIRAALPALKRALDRLTRIYLRQVDEELPDRLDRVLTGPPSVEREYWEFFLGPWNPLDDDAPAFPGALERRPGAALYPAALSAAELEARVAGLSAAEREAILDHYSLVREGGDGRLEALPYHEAYAEELGAIAAELREAAALVEEPGLKAYLELRARTLLDGDYRAADEAWVRLRESPLELVIGPYEVYMDRLAGLKAAYEGMLFSVDGRAGAALRAIEEALPALSKRFPLPAGSRAAVGGMAPMVVVDLLYSGGEARGGVMAAAFNLPNDPWVRGNVGWKQVMIRNVMRAKFEKVATPIAREILGDTEADFGPFFHFVLLHEVSHGLGPAYRANGSDVAKCLGTSYTAIEEAKADTGALVLLLEEGGRSGIPAYREKPAFESYVAGLFRSMRFGIAEAHGAANLIEFSWFLEKGVLAYGKGGSLEVRQAGLRVAASELLIELCRLEAEASPAEAAAFIARYGKVPRELKALLARLERIPTDIRPSFPI